MSMNRRWLYPYYVIVVLLLIMWLTGCDSGNGSAQASNPFSVEVRVETADGAPAEDAEVGAQPCYTNLSICASDDETSSVSPDGNQSAIATPRAVSFSLSAPEISSLYPNPFESRLTLSLATGTTSTVQSTVHLLNGEKVRSALTDVTLEHDDPGGKAWRLPIEDDNLSPGLYELRTTVRSTNDLVTRDTTLLIHAPETLSTVPPIGTTDAEGTVSTTEQDRFPPLFDPPSIPIRNTEGVHLADARVRAALQFIVTTNDGRQHTFRRTVSEGQNTLTLSLAP